MGPLSAGPMKSVKSLIDRRQEIEQQLQAIGMRQPPTQTVKSPDGHLVIHAPFDIQDLKKRVQLKSQLAQIDLKLGPAKPVKLRAESLRCCGWLGQPASHHDALHL